MIISVPPNILDESSSSDTLATEGRAVTLNCDATGTPKVTTIKNYNNNKKITNT